MRIHKQNSEQFINQIARAIAKDPSSLENWRCLHISHVKDDSADWLEETISRLAEAHKDLDCDVIHCQDQDVLFISRHLQVDQLYEIADYFIRATHNAQGKPGEIALYDMYGDWRMVQKLLLGKVNNAHEKAEKPERYNFGEIDSLNEVFSEAKKLRNARMPLHVMVVEDDILTRRIVSNAFKEDYALITAGTAKEAIANYLMHAPDIVFLDIGLPDTSGFNVLQQIITSDPGAYVVMFSGNSYLENVASALSEGASGFISKPFKKDKMRRYIEESSMHHRHYSA